MNAHKQKRILDRGCDVLVATPGRLWDLIKTVCDYMTSQTVAADRLSKNDDLAVSIRELRFLVIDEADRMIENGHFAEVENIVRLSERDAGSANFAVTRSIALLNPVTCSLYAQPDTRPR